MSVLSAPSERALRKGAAVGVASGATAGLLYAAITPGTPYPIGLLAGIACGLVAGVLSQWVARRP